MSDDIIDVLAVIAEERIREAMERGEFEGLAGAGMPLPPDGLANVPAELRAAYTLLKNNGFLPPEVELRNEIARLEERLATSSDPAETQALRAEVAQKSITYEIMLKRWQRRR